MAASTGSNGSANRPPREMEFEEGTSHKFWRIELTGSSHTVTFGKVGTNGQTQTKEFDSDAEAAKSYDKLVAEKLKKGYVEQGTPASTASAVTAPAAKEPAAAKASKSATKKSDAKSAATEPSDATGRFVDPPIFRPRRELQFDDGSSQKFWQIELQGASHRVTFGKVGTSGQSQTKDFETKAEAAKAYDKLVAEKLKKGYTDPNAPSAAPDTTVTAAAKVASSSKAAKPAAKAESKPIPETPTAKVNLDFARELKLSDEDWATVLVRRGKTVSRSVAAPYDHEGCLSRLAKLKTETYGWDTRWKDLKLASGLDPKEAHFWLEAMTKNRGRETTLAKFAEKLKSFSATGKVTASQVGTMLLRQERDLPEEIGIILGNLLTPTELLDVWQENEGAKKHSYFGVAMANGIQRHVIPYWSDADRKDVAAQIRKKWDPSLSPADFYSPLPREYYLAAALGMPEVSSVVSSWADDRYTKDDWTDHYQRPQELVFALGSPEQIGSEWRRLRLRMRNGAHVRTFLACTEYAALDCVRDSILKETNKEACDDLLKAFALVIAPEAAPYLLECKLSAKAPATARQWLDENLGCSIAGLIETAAGRGKLAEAAIDFLRNAKRMGHAATIESALANAPPEVAGSVRQSVLEHQERIYVPFDDKSTPKWLSSALAEASQLKKSKLPSWASPATLPPIVVGEQRLNDAQVAVVLNTLAGTVISGKHALFDSLHDHADVRSLDDFAWKLFQCWSEDGAPSKEKWAMGAIGLLGGDCCALKLTPLVRNWPGESQHQRAVFGLECLRAIGSNVALMQLSGIAQKLKFKGLKTKAEEFVEAIAKDKGLTRAELEDRVVPDCGLDENGKREFSFGPRSFSFVLGPELKPMIRDADGKIRDDLPKPSSKDDAEVSKASVDEWKLLKKQIKEVAKIQASRLEQAMVTGRRWTVEEFETLLVRHPLMTHLARKLLWGSYDENGILLSTFRVTDERDFADSEENEVSLRDAARVGVIHPLNLTDSQRAAWGEVLSDYEIVPPFPQLGRPVHSLEPGEAKSNNLIRFKGMKLVAPTLVFGLEKLGWIRGVGLDGGCFTEHSKQFPAADVTAVVQYDGNVGMGWISPDEILEVTDCQFVKGMRSPSGYGWDTADKLLKLSDVDPIVVSEVIADLNELKSKAK